jgi:hypothetical protein
MSQPIPAYLLTLHENGAYLGGVMITDHHGVPLDFKYTDPTVPTKVQRILYGKVLEQYVRYDVIVGALCKDLDYHPSFFVVSQHQLFEIAEVNSSLTLLSVQRTQFNPLGDKGTVTRSKENECLVQGWSDPSPLRLVFGRSTADVQEGIIKDVLALSKHMDIVEPIERVETVLKTLIMEKGHE